MADNKKKVVWISVVTGIVIISLLLYVYRDKLFGRKIKDPNENNEQVPNGSPTPKWVAEKFDLNVGMFGLMIAKLQKALGILDDGKFGTDTKNAVIAKGYTVPLKKVDYDKIVNPSSTAGGNNFADLKKALQGGYTNIPDGISYPMSGQNDKYKFQFYSNARWNVSKLEGTSFIKKGGYSKGGQKMTVDGGATYSVGPYQNMQNIIKTTLND